MESAKSRLVTFGIALMAAVLALVLRWMTQPILGELTPYFFLFPITVLIASRYGLGAGILTATVGMMATEILLLEPSRTPVGWSGAILRMTILLLTAVYSGFLSARLHQSQRRLASSLREAKHQAEEMRRLLDVVPAAVWIAHDPECRTILGNRYANQLAETPSGENIAPLLWSAYRFFTPDGRECSPGDLPMQRACAANQEVRGAEFSVEVAGGPRKHLFGHAIPLRDEAGLVRGCVGAFMDVTEMKRERKEWENALLKRESKFRGLYESNIISIAFWNVNGEILDANEAFCRLVGVTPEQLEARQISWHKITPPELLPRDFQAIEQILERGFNEPYEKVFIHEDGHRVPVLTAGGMLAGSSTDGVAFFVDLSKQKLTEESLRKISAEMEKARQAAEEANQAKSLFLATMSHEIRTPLNAIMGFAHLLVSPDLPEKEREDFAVRIERNGQVLVHLIDDILDLSKIEAGKLELETMEMNLQEAVADIAAVMEHKAQEKGILFSMAAVAPIPESIRSDPTRFRQILTNIIGNAIKFTDQGEVRVSLQTDPTLKNLQITVCDTGIGLTSEQAAKLFQPFTQAKVSTTRQYGGTGLGLVLARRLAQALGGDVKLVESRPGQGTTFEISIALEGAKYHVRPIPPVKIREKDETRLDGLRILLAEDVPDNQLLATRLLTMAGARVDVANDGQEAIDKASAGPYDVILMDMRMPRLDGIEATKKLRRQGYEAPIVALTAHALRDEVDRSLAAGCNAHLAKPIRRDELVQVIRRSVGLPAGDAVRP